MNRISTFRSAMVALISVVAIAFGGAALAQTPAPTPTAEPVGHAGTGRFRDPRPVSDACAGRIGDPGAGGDAGPGGKPVGCAVTAAGSRADAGAAARPRPFRPPIPSASRSRWSPKRWWS